MIESGEESLRISNNDSQKRILWLSENQTEVYLNQIKSRITEKIKPETCTKTLDDCKLIEGCLYNHFIFYNLSEPEIESVREEMFCCEVDAGVEVYSAGEMGSCFFIVKEGVLQLLVDDKFKKEFRPNDGFGEIALLYQTERTSTVRTREKCTLWGIDRKSFREAVEKSIIQEYTENRKCLEGARFFSGLTKEQKDLIAASLVVKQFKKNQTIIKEGDPGSAYYYIKEGSASVYKGSKFIRKLYKGEGFGQQSLYYNTMRQLTIKADDEVITLILGRDTLNRLMGDKIYEVTFKNFIRWAFDNNNLLQKLNKTQTEKLIDNMKISNYKANETIFRRGVVGFQKIVVVIEGQLKNVKNGSIVAGKGQCFGEEFFLDQYHKKPMDDQIIMQSYGVLSEMTDLTFIQSMGLNHLRKIQRENHCAEQGLQLIGNLILEKQKQINLNKMIFVDKIANGQFGQLYLAKSEQKYFCLKRMDKKMLRKYDVSKFIINEAIIFKKISYRFICNLAHAFHTKSSVFYVMKYVNGEDLYDVINKIGLLSSDDARFYAANIILILEYLHNKNIIVRDIKPQNFMVDLEGFLILMNLSVAKLGQKEKKSMLKTYTIIGTPHYMAPDIILGKGYTNMVDLWSLGVTIFEFLCGYLPFGDQAEGAYEIYEEIMQNQVKFPQFISDKKAKKFIEQLLSHNAESRINGSYENLKKDIWLQSVHWEQFSKSNSVKLKIPYKPQEKKIRTGKGQIPILDFLSKEEKIGKSQIYHQNEWSNFGEFIDFK